MYRVRYSNTGAFLLRLVARDESIRPFAHAPRPKHRFSQVVKSYEVRFYQVFQIIATCSNVSFCK